MEANENKTIPTVVKEGTMRIGDMDIRVYVLDNGERIIPKEDAEKIFAALGITWEEAGTLLALSRSGQL